MELSSYLDVVRTDNDQLVTDLDVISVLLVSGANALNSLNVAAAQADEPGSPDESLPQESGSGLVLPVSVTHHGQILLAR